jgi:hypothetical protein
MGLKFSGGCGSVSEVAKSVLWESVFWEPVFWIHLKKSKSLKGFGSTVRRVWVEGTISGGAEFVSNRTNERTRSARTIE